jgi:PDZ domain-containing secreted protein
VLISIDGQNVSSADRFDGALGDLRDGQRVTIVYARRGEMTTTRLAVQVDPSLELRSLEQLGGRPTPAQQRFRDDWLGPKAGS